ncbi:MAG TPA: nuclear transport factor 2 family protein [Solirubrobacteraceae bacterium]|nr:nuclear transport factor 2 family protein [Solirubrobacteraceae bacterium]
MSENLDLVRSIYADWERGDFFGGSGDWIDPNIDFVMADGPDAGVWHGRAGLIEGTRALFRAWNDWRCETEEYVVLDAERVLVLLRVSGRGKTSGLEVGQVAVNLFHVQAGKVTKLAIYWDRANALAEFGLEE